MKKSVKSVKNSGNVQKINKDDGKLYTVYMLIFVVGDDYFVYIGKTGNKYLTRRVEQHKYNFRHSLHTNLAMTEMFKKCDHMEVVNLLDGLPAELAKIVEKRYIKQYSLIALNIKKG